jgi:predicted aldo/keto reductase-like oxidoreductase
MRLRALIILIFLFLFGHQRLNAQVKHQIWSHMIFQNTITFNFDNELFVVDTINDYEGYVFYFKFLNDSNYFRFNYATALTTFECCSDDSIYKETRRSIKLNTVDRMGIHKLSNLYWREIQHEDFEIVYNNCSENKLLFFNAVMDSILTNLKE